MKFTFERCCAVVQIVLLCVICGKVLTLRAYYDPHGQWYSDYSNALRMYDSQTSSRQAAYESMLHTGNDQTVDERKQELISRGKSIGITIAILEELERKMPIVLSDKRSEKTQLMLNGIDSMQKLLDENEEKRKAKNK